MKEKEIQKLKDKIQKAVIKTITLEEKLRRAKIKKVKENIFIFVHLTKKAIILKEELEKLKNTT